jgi:hypothetical protein
MFNFQVPRIGSESAVPLTFCAKAETKSPEEHSASRTRTVFRFDIGISLFCCVGVQELVARR